eukprot:9214402-Pyramimonas_sp.AAC.1
MPLGRSGRLAHMSNQDCTCSLGMAVWLLQGRLLPSPAVRLQCRVYTCSACTFPVRICPPRVAE